MRKPDRPAQEQPTTSPLARLFETKPTPLVMALFFVALALMCAGAAGVGWVAHSLGRPRGHVISKDQAKRTSDARGVEVRWASSWPTEQRIA